MRLLITTPTAVIIDEQDVVALRAGDMLPKCLPTYVLINNQSG
jgi:hypothetical protein